MGLTKPPFLMLGGVDLRATDVASAGTLNLDAIVGNYAQVTGTTTVNAITLSEGKAVWIRFTGSLSLVNGASLVLPGGLTIQTAVGDWALFIAISTVVYCIDYVKANGTSTSKLSGDVVQAVQTVSSSAATGTTTTPLDDTVPQISEGTEFITQAITPTNASNNLLIEAVLFVASNTASIAIIAALHQDAAANSLAAEAVVAAVVNKPFQIVLRHVMAAGTTSATTFRIRIGPESAATVTFNGAASARLFGGVTLSSLRVSELKA